MGELFATLQGIATNELFGSIFWGVLIAAATIVASRLAARAVRHILRRDGNPLPTATIIVNIVRATIWVIGGSIVLDSCFGVNTSSLIAALGVGGIAVSLGFQDTLANLIGGLQVTFMGIVKPGDNIEVGDEPYTFNNTWWAGISRYLVLHDPTLLEDPIRFRDSDIDCYGLLPVSYLPEIEPNIEVIYLGSTHTSSPDTITL